MSSSLLAATFLLPSIVFSTSSCGNGAIPFRFEVTPEGMPLLGCATPQCFGTPRSQQGSDTETVFFRDGDNAKSRQRYRDAPAQNANCPPGFESGSCASTTTWVGGFEYDADEIRLQCCRYDGLKFSAEVGRPVVQSGEVYSGGEVIRDGRQTGFDLISNLRRIQSPDGSVSYELTVFRLNCLPDPPEDTVQVKLNFEEEISRITDKAKPPEISDQVEAPSNIEDVFADPKELAFIEQNAISAGGGGGGGDLARGENGLKGGEDFGRSKPRTISTFEVSEELDTSSVSNDHFNQPLPPPQDNFVQVGEVVQPMMSPGYYYPVGGGYTLNCFSGDSFVETTTGRKKMRELQIGDDVTTLLDAVPSYTRVLSWMHRLPEEEADFVQLRTENGFSLLLTPQHFIYRVKCDAKTSGLVRTELVYAQNIAVGDCVYTMKQRVEITQVNSSVIVAGRGVYAPMTSSGDLVVDGVYASCHTLIKSSTVSQTLMGVIDSLEQLFLLILPSPLLDIFQDFSSLSGNLPFGSKFFYRIAGDIIPLQPVLDN